jgi:hypothetical protein
MTIKTYDGSAWQSQKSLQIYSNSTWNKAKQGWIYNGSQWKLMYPEYPSYISGASIYVSSGTSGAIGSTYAINVGTWSSLDSYGTNSYAYQWTRSGSDISGATSSTYTTVAADVESVIGCKLTATNQRGSTTITLSTDVTMLPQITTINAYDYTVTPNAPGSISMTTSGLSYSGSWTAGSSATSYEGTGSGTAGTPSFNYGAQTFSGTGTAGNASVSVRSVNTNYQIFVSWSVAPGAISYDLYKNGVFYVNVAPGTNNYYIYSAPDTNSYNFTVYPKSTSYQGYGVQSSNVSASAKYSSYATAGPYALSQPVPSGGSVSWTASSVTVGSTISASTSGWSNSPTSYDIRIVRGTSGVIISETLVASSTSSSVSYTIPSGDVGYYYKAFAYAINAGGTSSSYANTSDIGPVPTPVVIPSGGSAYLSGGVSTGNTLSASTSGWSGSPTSYFIKITRGTAGVISGETTVASSFSSSTSYTVAAGDAGYYFKSFATASNSAGTSSEVASGELGPATNPVTITKPTISASNSYSGTRQWTLSITHTGGSVPTSFDWGIQFSNSNGGTVLSSATGSGTWTAGSGGTQTVTRNSATYTWARWTGVTATNSAGTSTSQTTSWA